MPEIVDGIKGLRISRSTPPAQSRLIHRPSWAFAIALNLWTVLTVTLSTLGYFGYRQPAGVYILTMSVGWLTVTVIFDVVLITNAFAQRFARGAGPA